MPRSDVTVIERKGVACQYSLHKDGELSYPNFDCQMEVIPHEAVSESLRVHFTKDMRENSHEMMTVLII